LATERNVKEIIMTHSQKRLFLINIVGGILVLGSYVYGLLTHPGERMLLWGNLPEAVRPVYTASMFAAAGGYFFFLYHLVFKAPSESFRLPFGLPFNIIHILFIMILIPSALWMSLTFAYISDPSGWLWAVVRITLYIVGTSSALLLGTLVSLKVTSPKQFWMPSVIGAMLFTFHTLILDASIWPLFFPISN